MSPAKLSVRIASPTRFSGLEKIMNQRILMYLLMAVSLIANSAAFSETGQPTTPPKAEQLFGERQPAPEAIKLEIKTNKAPDEVFKRGDRIIFYVKPDRECRLAVFNVAANGDITILFPNKRHPSASLEAGKEFVLFGDDSKLKLVMGQNLAEAKTYFLASAKPFSIAPLQFPPKKDVVRIPSGSEQDMEVLANKIHEMADDSSFTQILFPVKGGPMDLNLMGPAPAAPKMSAPAERRMPSKDESDSPESITGVAGAKQRNAK